VVKPQKQPKVPGAAPSARRLAALVIERVLRDSAYLSPALDAELLRHPQLEARERALTTELCYGCLRCYGFLLGALGEHTKKKLPSGDPELLSELLLGAYQILLLDRVPASAAVNAAVGAVRKKRGQRVAGFANALLRQLAKRQTRPTRAEAALESVPAWLSQRLTRDFGELECQALLGAGPATPLVMRLVTGAGLSEAFAAAKACRHAPRAYELPRSLSPEERRAGGFVVQEEGAQLIAWALGAAPGEAVLDACAGRGAKASLIWENMQQRGRFWVADAHPSKLTTLARDFERLGLDLPSMTALDWTQGQADVPVGFQRALVDAPCTGSGTLRKRPEILLRLKPEDPARMGQLQEAIVRSVATRLAPEGRLVYAVCSVFEEECEAVLLRLGDILEPVPFDSELILRMAPAGGHALRLLPGVHGTDGYFLASLRKK